MLELLLVPVLPELDELPLFGRLILLELLFVPVLPELDELPLLGRFTLPEPLLEVFPLGLDIPAQGTVLP